MALGYLDTWRVEPVERPESCETSGAGDTTCVYRDIRAGRYLAAQGPFATEVRAGGSGATELDLGCVAACGAEVVVQPQDACATTGSFVLSSGWEAAGRQALASVEWRAGEPFVLRALPCLPGTTIDIRAQGCEPLQDHLPLEEIHARWSFEPRTEGELMVQVIDAETEDPIEGATLQVVGRPELERSDAQGWIGPYAQEPSDYVPFLHRRGYAQRLVMLHDFDEDGVFVAYLHPVEEVVVRCEDSGSPCPEGTSMLLDRTNPEARFGRCARQDEWSWSCEVLEGDWAYARAGRRTSESEPLEMDGEDTVWLPPHEGNICLDWAVEANEPCTLFYGELRDASEPPCDSCTSASLTSGEPLPVPLEVGTTAQVTVACAERAWSGEATVTQLGAVHCESIELLPRGVVCATGRGACRARSKRWELGLGPDFNGCSEPVPAGSWSVSCEGLWFDVEVEPGETVDVLGDGETLQERLDH